MRYVVYVLTGLFIWWGFNAIPFVKPTVEGQKEIQLTTIKAATFPGEARRLEETRFYDF